jgi:DNA-binding LacI/PurR family transcriptional regulator
MAPGELLPTVEQLKKKYNVSQVTINGVRANSIWIDDMTVGRMATRHLLDLGHERIVIMLSKPPNPASSKRLQGWTRPCARPASPITRS